MLEFLQSNWKDIAEIVVSLILGFFGGVKYTKILNKNKLIINGNGNNVSQKGNEYNVREK